MLSQDLEFMSVHTLTHAFTVMEEFEKPFEPEIVVGGVRFATMEKPNIGAELMRTSAFEVLKRPNGIPPLDEQKYG